MEAHVNPFPFELSLSPFLFSSFLLFSFLICVETVLSRTSQSEVSAKIHRPSIVELTMTPQSTATYQQLLVSVEMKLDIKASSSCPNSPLSSCSLQPMHHLQASSTDLPALLLDVGNEERRGGGGALSHAVSNSVDYIFYKAVEKKAKECSTPQHAPSQLGGATPKKSFPSLRKRNFNRSVSFATFPEREASPVHSQPRRGNKIVKRIKRFFREKRPLQTAHTHASIRIERQVSDEGFETSSSEPILGDQRRKRGEGRKRRRRKYQHIEEETFGESGATVPPLTEHNSHPLKRHSTGIMKGRGSSKPEPRRRHTSHFEISI